MSNIWRWGLETSFREVVVLEVGSNKMIYFFLCERVPEAVLLILTLMPPYSFLNPFPHL
jgi:hypothetical protein